MATVVVMGWEEGHSLTVEHYCGDVKYMLIYGITVCEITGSRI